MEFKKNKRKFNLYQKDEVGRIGVERKSKHEQQSKEVWNEKRKKWTDPASQTGYIGPTVREIFSDMKDEPHDSKDFQACYKFVRRCIHQKEGVFDIEGNVKNKSRCPRPRPYYLAPGKYMLAYLPPAPGLYTLAYMAPRGLNTLAYIAPPPPPVFESKEIYITSSNIN